MYKFSTTQLSSVLAIGTFGILAACSPKADETTDTLASTPPATATTPAVDAPWTDANVVEAITVANQGEIDYSQIAAEKATNPEVKSFAQTMVKDHGAMLEAVKSLATRLNVTPAANDKANDLREENQKDINDLNGKAVGKDFDVEFMEEQVDMHQETLDLLNDLDNRTTNADLKAAIAEAKPKVQAHLDQAKAIKDKVD